MKRCAKPQFGNLRGFVLAFLVGGLHLSAVADSKLILLRNEKIRTERGGSRLPASQLGIQDREVSGLYLIQFSKPFQGEWRNGLRELGVELLNYIPDDSFIARLEKTRLERVKNLPYVWWCGPYLPQHKLYAGLLEELKALKPNHRVRIKFLVSRNFTADDETLTGALLSQFEIESRTRLGTVLRGPVNSDELVTLAESPVVLWIEPDGDMKLLDEVASKIVGGNGYSSNVNQTRTQELGYDGRGVSVAVVDSGLHTGTEEAMHPDLAGRVDAFLVYGDLPDAADYHSHGTHVSGIIAGNGATGEADTDGALYGLGVAPKAHLVVQRVFDEDGRDDLPRLDHMTRDAVRAGAVIGSNSWGEDVQGRYDLSAAQFDALVRDADPETLGQQSYVLQFSAGNAGPGQQTIDSPAVGKNVIATGASQNERTGFFIYPDGHNAMADFSSRGPCEDGRFKPDLVAPGTWVASLQSSAASDFNAWAPISGNYQYQGGTSQAGPHVSGAAAVFVQYYRELQGGATPSPALVKAALINSAVDMNDSMGTGPVPNNHEGWGRLALTNLIGSERRAEFVDQEKGLKRGEVDERLVIVSSADQVLKITLAYTDVPGLPAALLALVNDLDLEVISPDGKVYRGNQFIEGESVEGTGSGDAINNVEAVHLTRPLLGEYLVRVHARNVVQDALNQDETTPRQDYSLVISGGLSVPGAGFVVLDRPSYTAPGVIQLKLIDADLAGAARLPVQLKSSSEINGLIAELMPTPIAGIFTGAVATAQGPAMSDGLLQIQHGDRIEVTYLDNSPNRTVTVQARADLISPTITSLTATNKFGKEVISWRTDEPTLATVFYGTNLHEIWTSSSRGISDYHQIELNELTPNSVYKYFVVGTDQAGNSVTNDNGGHYFEFIPKPVATVLLVNAYVPDDPMFEVPDIPLETYTDPLDQIKISYDIWNLTDLTSPSPTSDDLRPYRVVIWRLSDSLLGNSTLTSSQQNVLQAYFESGGSLFLSSMELLTRLGPSSSFRTNVLQVQSFEPDVGIPQVRGRVNDRVSGGMEFLLNYSGYDNKVVQSLGQSPDVSDALTVTTNAAPIFFDLSTERVAGLRFPRFPSNDNGKIVFLSFPFDAVPNTGEVHNSRSALLRKVLAFLAPGLGGLGTITIDRSAYTLPDLITIEVADSDLVGKDRTMVNCFSPSMPEGVAVPLSPTAQPGHFRGSVKVGANSPDRVPVGQLRASPGESLRIEYLDTSHSGVVTAHAVIDNSPPVISELEAQPEFEEAQVNWTTSEDADALVQFGESTFLGRTAYRAEFADQHQLTLVGLQPNRKYYYQVVSRDPAGNTTVDDNGGELYSFETFKPLQIPWSDPFESTNSPGAWSIQSAGDSFTEWALGVPANGFDWGAHSPPQVFGSNLQGTPISTADTLLVSPALQLPSSGTPRLRFWHRYDFSLVAESDVWEYGQLLVSTNMNSDWVLLQEYHDRSTTWERQEIDLSPYNGRVVQFGWAYKLLAIESLPRPGWMIDDVSISISDADYGTIQISNNLSQASFTLIGPISQSGAGIFARITNAPAGTYVVRFGDVPFYQAPLPQTNYLSASGLNFEGNYSFTDINLNGISDAWEQHHFDTVAPSHSATLDSDRDGQNDLAEFLAGTDPNDRASNLRLIAPGGLDDEGCHLKWAAAPGYMYRVLISGNALTWVPLSDWLRAETPELRYTVPKRNLASPVFFRLEAHP